MQTLFKVSDAEWPPKYKSIFQWRQERLLEMRADPKKRLGALEYYKTRPKKFIPHWLDTYDPRNAGKGLTRMPFVLFQRQLDFVDFLMGCLEDEEDGLAEKARDMGATWVCVGFSVWLWRFFKGSAVGWGSRKEQLVDKLGDPDSIFEKLRMSVNGMPDVFKPAGFRPKEHMSYMRVVNPENGSTITGEAGDNIGRGGRKLIYFKDESAHYVRPQSIEAALGDNTRVQIDISSVNGTGNVFHNRRDAGVDWEPGKTYEPGQTRVFVFDWTDHPAKTQEWYETRKKKAAREGLMHIFEQEVNRNYASAVLGVLIKPEWVKASVDAHIALGWEETGPWSLGFDVADDGGDTNALLGARNGVISTCDEWDSTQERDVGASTRRVLNHAGELRQRAVVNYDCNGLGAGVKSEANRLEEIGDVRLDLVTLVPWSASGPLIDPETPISPSDKSSPKNKDFFENFKAQAWWMVARRFENTFRAIEDPSISFSPEEMVSISSDTPNLRKLMKELSQPTRVLSANMKVKINKKPEGTKSPNLADGCIQALCPAKTTRMGVF